jgi:hypothetical protein
MAVEHIPVFSAELSAVAAEQRRVPRHKMRRLVYVLLDETNGGILRDLSEDGLTIQAVSPLQSRAQVSVSFNLTNPKTKIEAVGQVVWSNSIGQAGIQFDGWEERTRTALRNWLAANSQDGREPGLLGVDVSDAPAEETVATRGAVAHSSASTLLASPDCALANDVNNHEPMLEFAWWPRPISAGKFARFVDVLAVCASVLLFYVVVLLISRELLPWLPSLEVLCGGGLVFAGLYRLWFTAFRLGTPGAWMAGLAGDTSSRDSSDERDWLRFR